MNGKTHLAIGVFLTLLLLPSVTHRVIFVPIVLLASLLPDIDSAYSTFGHKRIFRPLQLFVKHRGIIHSLTFCVFITALFAFLIPVLALPFFLGYGGHLLADSLTLDGIRPFWPLKKRASGKILTGGMIEQGIFIALIAANVLLVVSLLI